ncbi:hypothetical protein vseg_001115 [Gypsophila vaccaria]
MSSILAQIPQILILFSLGFRRLHSSSSLYLKNPSFYTSKPWFFVEPKSKNLDFYALLLVLPVISLSYFSMFLSYSEYPSYRFSFLQCGLLILMFWAVLVVIICRESCHLLVIGDECFVYVFGGVCFFVEYAVTGNVVSGVGSIMYELLGHLTLVCAFSCLYLSVWPTAFLGDFCLSCGLVFKGTWVLQVGLSLYVEAFGLKGCHTMPLLPGSDMVDVKCDLVEDESRGVALVNFLFVCHAIVVFVVCFGMFGLLSWKEGMRCGNSGGGGGPLLPRVESRGTLLQSVPELEMA